MNLPTVPSAYLEKLPSWQRDLIALFAAAGLGLASGLGVTELCGLYAIVWWLSVSVAATYAASLAGGRCGILLASACANLCLLLGFHLTRGFSAVERAMLHSSQFDTGTRDSVDHEIWMTFLTAQCLCLLIGFGIISGRSAARRRMQSGPRPLDPKVPKEQE